MKIIGIVEDSPLTGVRYGLIDVPETGTPISTPTPRVLATQQKFINAKNKRNLVRKTCKIK